MTIGQRNIEALFSLRLTQSTLLATWEIIREDTKKNKAEIGMKNRTYIAAPRPSISLRGGKNLRGISGSMRNEGTTTMLRRRDTLVVWPG